MIGQVIYELFICITFVITLGHCFALLCGNLSDVVNCLELAIKFNFHVNLIVNVSRPCYALIICETVHVNSLVDTSDGCCHLKFGACELLTETTCGFLLGEVSMYGVCGTGQCGKSDGWCLS